MERILYPKNEPMQILQVDDDKHFLQISKAQLEKLDEIIVDTTSSITEALAMIKETKYDAILSEYYFPNTNGLTFFKKLRKRERSIPFILFTKKVEEKILIKALNLGINKFFYKFHDLEKFKKLRSNLKTIVQVQREENSRIIKESLYQYLIDTATDISFIITDLSGKEARILEFSKGAERIFGYTRDEAIGKPVGILHLPEDVTKFPDEIKSLSQGKEGFTGETILVRKSGEQFPALFTTYPIFDSTGSIIATFGTSIEITERKKIEERLKASEMIYKMIVENASNIIIIVQEIKITFINSNGIKILRYSKNELISESCDKLFHPDDRSILYDIIDNVLSGEEISPVSPLRVITKDERMLWVDIHSVFIPWNMKPAVLIYLSDITHYLKK
jgi:PAS domain S-box-containing protein